MASLIRRQRLTAPGLIPLLIPLLLVIPARGQTELERFERQLEAIQRETRILASPDIPPGQRLYLDFGGYLTVNAAAIDDTAANAHNLWSTNLTLYGRANLDGAHELFFRIATGTREFNKGDSFDGNDSDWQEPRVERGYYRFDLARSRQAYQGKTPDYNLVVLAGRQLVHWANGLVLSQELDGGLITFSVRRLSIDILAAVTRESNADFDSSRPGFDDHFQRGFYGGMISFQVTPSHRPYAYVLFQTDNNDPVVSVVGPVTTRFDYGSFYLGVGFTGAIGQRWLYGGELVYEGGTGLSNSFDATLAPIAQTEEHIAAYAANARIEFLPGDRRNSRFVGELTLASGDGDRFTTSNTFGGNRPGTKDTAFNAFGLINTGLAFNPAVSNIVVLRGGASTFPISSENPVLARIQVGADVLFFGKLDPNGPIDEPTDPGDFFLGGELDLYLNWRITSDLSLAFRYGIFLPSDNILTSTEPRHFIYGGVTYGF